MQSSNASSQLDPNPTWLVKICCDELTPVITKMVNLSISEGIMLIAGKLCWFDCYADDSQIYLSF